MVVLFVIVAVVVLVLGIVDRVRGGGAHRSSRSTAFGFHDSSPGGSGGGSTGGWTGYGGGGFGDGGCSSGGDGGSAGGGGGDGGGGSC